MLFAHDTEAGLVAVAALVNTAPDEFDDEELGDLGDLDRFLTRWSWTGSRAHDEAELERVRALRPRLRRLWEDDDHAVVVLVNQLLREGPAMPQLVAHDGWDYHLHATDPGAPLDARMAVEAAMALVDVVRMGERSRLRVCAGDACRDVLVDLSKNSSRRFCGTSCGNRANVAAYRARRRGQA